MTQAGLGPFLSRTPHLGTQETLVGQKCTPLVSLTRKRPGHILSNSDPKQMGMRHSSRGPPAQQETLGGVGRTHAAGDIGVAPAHAHGHCACRFQSAESQRR